MCRGSLRPGRCSARPRIWPPSRIEGGEVDARADVFGLGVLLYECMVGHLPFEGKNPAQVLRRVLEGSFAAPDREMPSVGGRWSKILSRALAKDAADRYPSANDMLAALRQELDAVGFDDPEEELRAFFADPEGYRTAHAARLVTHLTKRGVDARKRRDIAGAADDFNRALAYAPQDPALLKLIGSLRRGRATRRAVLATLAIAAASLVLGSLAFVISRSMRRTPALSPAPVAERSASSASSAVALAPPLVSADRAPLRPHPALVERAPRHNNADPPPVIAPGARGFVRRGAQRGGGQHRRCPS